MEFDDDVTSDVIIVTYSVGGPSCSRKNRA